MCGEVIGPFCDHAPGSPRGPLKKQQHEQMADTLGEFAVETGAHVRREAFVAEFCSSAAESWLDLLVDVTIRHPAHSRYQPNASNVAGHAAQQAEEEKTARYPAAGGRRVTPFAVETWGRLGEHAEALLTQLAAAASRRDLLRGRVAIGRLQRWRATLDACLQKGVARTLAAACYGLPGRAFNPCPPHL